MADVPLWQDDFESGDGITVNYQSTGVGWDTIIETANGVGVSGGWAIQSKGTTAQKYDASFRKRIPTFTPTTASEAALGYIQFDDNLAYLPAFDGSFPFTHLEWVNPSTFISTYLFGTYVGKQIGDNGGTVNFIEIYDANFDIIGVFDNAITPGAFHFYRFEFQTSSWNSGLADWNSDGWVKFYQDNVLIGTATGGYIGFDHSAPVWNSVAQNPIGQLDNFEFGEFSLSPPAPTTPTVVMVNSTPCCGTSSPGTPSPNAGPVLTGTGWTPQCTGGGEVPTETDLTDSQNWDTLTERGADVWFEMRLAKYPAVNGTTTYRWAKTPLADTGSWKEGRLISCGKIQRRCSDTDGNYSVGGATVVVDDSDGLIRGLLEQGTVTEYFLNREAGIYLLSPAGRVSALTPRTLFRGWISDVQTLKGRQVRIEIADVVGSQMSGFNLEKTIGSVLLGDLSTGLEETLRDTMLPIYAGELSDYGALDVNGNDAARGLVPAYDIGMVDITNIAGGTPTPTIATPPVITANSVTGATGQEGRYYGATLITPYGESLMSNIVFCDGASVRNVSNYNEISGTFDSGDPLLATNINKVRIWYGPSPTNMVGWLDEANYNGVGVFGYFDGAAAWPTATRDENDIIKYMTAPATGAVVSTDIWNIMAVCLGYGYDFLNYYGSDLANGVEPRRVELDPSVHNVEIIGPEDASWPYPDPWIEMNGIRFTGFLARGNLLKHHQDGVVTFAVNICGPHDDSDLLINQAFRQLLWFLNEHVAKNGGTGYKTGDYYQIESYANGDPLFQTTKFEDAQDLTATWLGDALGYLGMIAITEPISVREFVRRFCLTFGCRLAHNHHGQVFPLLVEAPTDPTLGRAIREHIEIKDIGDPVLAHDEIMNRVISSYHFDPDANEFRNTGIVTEDTTSIAAHTPGGVVGGTDRRGVRQGEDREQWYTNDADTAADVIDRELTRRARRPRYVPVMVDLMGLEQEIDAQVRVTHHEGLGTSGDVLAACKVLEHETDADSLDVTLMVQDLRTM